MAKLPYDPQVECLGVPFQHFVSQLHEAPETNDHHEYGGKDDPFLLQNETRKRQQKRKRLRMSHDGLLVSFLSSGLPVNRALLG